MFNSLHVNESKHKPLQIKLLLSKIKLFKISFSHSGTKHAKYEKETQNQLGFKKKLKIS